MRVSWTTSTESESTTTTSKLHEDICYVIRIESAVEAVHATSRAHAAVLVFARIVSCSSFRIGQNLET